MLAATLGRIATCDQDPAVLTAAYRRLEADGLISMVWPDGDDLPSEVELTPAGRAAQQGTRFAPRDQEAPKCD